MIFGFVQRQRCFANSCHPKCYGFFCFPVVYPVYLFYLFRSRLIAVPALWHDFPFANTSCGYLAVIPMQMMSRVGDAPPLRLALDIIGCHATMLFFGDG